MSTSVVAATRRHQWLRRAVLALLALTAVGTLGVMVWAAGGVQDHLSTDDLAATVLFTAWDVAPVAGMGALYLLVHRAWPRGRVTAALGVAVFSSLTAAALASIVTSESSTAALGFLFLPLYQWLVAGAVTGVAALVHRLRSRGATAH